MPDFIIFHESLHFLVGSILAISFYRIYHNPKLIPVIFAVTFLIDLDHLFDYFYFAKNLFFWQFFGKVDFFAVSDKVFVPFHSWELVLLLGIWGRIKKSPLILAVCMSIAGHLLVDQFSYTSNPLAYSVIIRAVNHFSLPWYNGFY